MDEPCVEVSNSFAIVLQARSLAGVDVLSDVLAVIRTGRPRSALAVWRAPWAQHFAPIPGAVGFRVVVSGDCVLIPDGTQPVRLGGGDVVLLPSGCGHVLADQPDTPPGTRWCDPNAPDFDKHARVLDGSTGAPTVTVCGAFELAPGGGHPIVANLPDIVHLPAETTPDTGLRAAVDLLTAESATPGLGADSLIPTLVDMLLLYALRAQLTRSTPNGAADWGAALHDPHIAPALDAIHRDLARPWTVASLARLTGLSRGPFAKRFNELVGQPPIQYLTWWRMTTAAHLLRTSDTLLTGVASDVGYRSEFAFSTAFKRQFGTPPGAYRRHR